MDDGLFENLLWQDESERLDFKMPVYHLQHAYPDERIELANPDYA